MSDQVLGEVTRVVIMTIILSLLLLIGGVMILILIHICLAGGAFRRGSPNGAVVERGGAGSTSMSRADIEKLPCYDYIAKDERSSPVDCAVCLETFTMGDKCRLLPACKHSFHSQCVDAWLLKIPICPICRTTAHSWKGGLISGEESSHFSDLNVEMRGSQTTGSSHLPGIRIELGESPIIEGGHQSDIRTELREHQRVGSLHLNDAVIESPSRESQADVVGDQLTSDLSPLPHSALQSDT